ncbi:MAG: sigma-70 family RNA polymerase sigma factor [Candidatus Omnitrophica bacterium]|nr:sigma-70 family RNA polymerase sigma factor [Candidatus Omnitrophota bacterium]
MMDDPDSTRQSLLARIHDPQDREAWAEFVELYTPFVYNLVRRRGLQPADAADVTQDVMRSVFSSLGRFQHNQRPRSFRTWLVTIARRRLSDFRSRQGKQIPGSGNTGIMGLLHEQSVSADEEAEIEREYQQRLFQWAVDQIRHDFRDSTWQAFWRTYVDGESCESVAEQLQLSREAVYMARSRVLSSLRKRIREVEE